MARMNVERGVERIARQAEKLVAAAEKLVLAARKGDHSALADKLEKLRVDLDEHVKSLAEHRPAPESLQQGGTAPSHDTQMPVAQARVVASPQGSDLPVEINADVRSEDAVEEASKESYPASDPPAHY